VLHQFGTSPAMRKVLDAVERAAADRSHVIICGEPGTGRETVARAIHEQSRVKRIAFVKVEAGPHAPETFPLDVFGVPLRATRSIESRALERLSRASRLYQALGGTVFFENLVELPARLQSSLARLLRDREAELTDDREQIEFDVRVIAAADTMPERAVEEGRVRLDLFQRLSAVRIDLPPLRERRDDIPAMASAFVEERCRLANLPPKTLSEPALQLLAALPWYGNVWELKNLVEGLVLRVRSTTIELSDVLGNIQLDGRAKPHVILRTLREARVSFEREYITEVLHRHSGRVPGAAKTLGIQRANLYRKLRNLKVEKPRRQS
jgi:two-component system nitrogen regulation response regulator NtrX